ncbi:MAG: class I SAM-dependent methyltransferase [Aestuariivita sp.]|uniref:class I SAM-dependent DNA methyltransferase n=1 Tax=Aestuariivita sp. TaxID=1872407 RepID=UPI003BAE47F5
MSDAETRAAYSARADEYARLTNEANAADPRLAGFIAALPARGSVLDLGCGPGASAAVMAKADLRVQAVDATPEMVLLAAQHPGVSARLARFEDITELQAFDGIWANFSLLHATKADLPGHLARLYRALKPKGQFHIAMKLGTGEKRDRLGRFYAYYSEDELDTLLSEAGFTITERAYGNDPGLSGDRDDWISIRAHA